MECSTYEYTPVEHEKKNSHGKGFGGWTRFHEEMQRDVGISVATPQDMQCPASDTHREGKCRGKKQSEYQGLPHLASALERWCHFLPRKPGVIAYAADLLI
jgi:hypothetical protein